MIQKIPTIKNRKPRMSAIPAKVFSGLISEMIPAITSSTPKKTSTQRATPPTIAARPSCWTPEIRNIAPIKTPTVVTEAWSNCRMTRAMTIHRKPNPSHSHQSLLKPMPASLRSRPSTEASMFAQFAASRPTPAPS
jgi:hypothetical protein